MAASFCPLTIADVHAYVFSMKLRLHPLALLLSLAVILTPLARHGVAAGDGASYSLVICSENGTEVIGVDQDGNPVSAAHHCFECCLVANAMTVELRLPSSHRLVPEIVVWPDTNRLERQNASVKPMTRGPPALV